LGRRGHGLNGFDVPNSACGTSEIQLDTDGLQITTASNATRQTGERHHRSGGCISQSGKDKSERMILAIKEALRPSTKAQRDAAGFHINEVLKSWDCDVAGTVIHWISL
jgi:hypothetical protein